MTLNRPSYILWGEICRQKVSVGLIYFNYDWNWRSSENKRSKLFTTTSIPTTQINNWKNLDCQLNKSEETHLVVDKCMVYRYLIDRQSIRRLSLNARVKGNIHIIKKSIIFMTITPATLFSWGFNNLFLGSRAGDRIKEVRCKRKEKGRRDI